MPLSDHWSPENGEVFDRALYNAQMADLKAVIDPLLAVVDGDAELAFDAGKGPNYANTKQSGRHEWLSPDTSSLLYSWSPPAITPSDTIFTTIELPDDCPARNGKTLNMRISVGFTGAPTVHTPLQAGYNPAAAIIFRANLNTLTHADQGMHILSGSLSGHVPLINVANMRWFRCPNYGNSFQCRFGTSAGAATTFLVEVFSRGL